MPENIGPLSLSKREHFAALILGGMYANPEFLQIQYEAAASMAIDQADTLLEMLNFSAIKQEIEKTLDEMPDPDDVAMEELRKDSHQEYYRPSGSTELLEIPESPELDALRNELYSAEILLGGGEDE